MSKDGRRSIVVANPGGKPKKERKGTKMATKKKKKRAKRANPSKKRSHPKRKRSNPSHPHKKRTHRRKRSNPGHPHRRRRRARKNPGLLGVALSPVVGVLVEGTIKGVNAFATLSPWPGRVMSAVASVGGAALSVNHPRLGTAIATGGLSAGVTDPILTAIAKHMTPKASTTSGVGAIEASSGWPGRTRGELSPGSVPMMNAVEVDIGDFEYDEEGIGAVVVR